MCARACVCPFVLGARCCVILIMCFRVNVCVCVAVQLYALVVACARVASFLFSVFADWVVASVCLFVFVSVFICVCSMRVCVCSCARVCDVVGVCACACRCVLVGAYVFVCVIARIRAFHSSVGWCQCVWMCLCVHVLRFGLLARIFVRACVNARLGVCASWPCMVCVCACDCLCVYLYVCVCFSCALVVLYLCVFVP